MIRSNYEYTTSHNKPPCYVSLTSTTTPTTTPLLTPLPPPPLGMMDKFIKQDLNKDYKTVRSVPRVRDAAAQSSYARGQAGVMADCMTGYPGTPNGAGTGGAVQPQGRVNRPEANDNACRGKGTIHKVVLPSTPLYRSPTLPPTTTFLTLPH